MSPSPSGHARGSPFIPRHEEVVYVDEEVAFRKPSRHSMAGHDNARVAMQPQSRFGSVSPQARRSHSMSPSPSYQVNEAAYSARMRSPSPHHTTMARQSASPAVPIAAFVADVIQHELETERQVIMEETAKVRADIVSVRQQVLARREHRDATSPAQQWFESLSVLQHNRDNNVMALEAPTISLERIGRSMSRSRSRSPSPAAASEFKVGPLREGDRSPSPMVSLELL